MLELCLPNKIGSAYCNPLHFFGLGGVDFVHKKNLLVLCLLSESRSFFLIIAKVNKIKIKTKRKNFFMLRLCYRKICTGQGKILFFLGQKSGKNTTISLP